MLAGVWFLARRADAAFRPGLAACRNSVGKSIDPRSVFAAAAF
jgi:hypothetical protein